MTSASDLSRRVFLARLGQLGITVGVAETLLPSAAIANGDRAVVGFPGPWQFQLPKGAIILVSDQQLEDLTDPHREVDLSLSATPNKTTLRRLCAEHAARGARTIILAFDEFWSQYRAGQGGQPRQLTPDTEAYIRHVAKISETLKSFGLGLELSLLSPLEIGAGYVRQTGESGRWVQYREGYRDPESGRYTVSLWAQERWTNNKGTIELQRTGIRVFAFRERRIGRTAFYAVSPETIVELRQPAEVETAIAGWDGKQRRLIVRGEGDTDLGPLDRVLVVVSYATPEMDYFSPRALPFLVELVQRYHAAGVPLNGLYADEMHIQQDWGYANHHEEGQFALRYLTPNLAAEFARRHGPEFADFERWLVYFAGGQHGFYPNLEARLPAQHVLGNTPDDLARTALLRRRYFQLLQETVVELFARAKDSAETLYGHPLESRAHATWAQSPTIDFWNTRNQPQPPRQYDYTPDFLWSNTVQQAASACADYFKWNEFLTGGGNDHAEGGWSDRNYYGLALACSTGSLNRVPNAYAAAWGMPAGVHRRHRALENAFGCSPDPAFAAVGDYAHREVPVLFLYPSSLVAWEERFGSWMTQYGYANYVTPEKLLEHGRITDGTVDLLGRRYGTVAVLFEPLPPAGLLPLLEAFTHAGGHLIWSGPPPRLDLAGKPLLVPWQELFQIAELGFGHEGFVAAGGRIDFDGVLAGVPSQTVLTDFLVDLIYPVTPRAEAEVVARVGDQTIGVHGRANGGGTTTFLGCRPRDDQAASLGYEVRTWFEVLRSLGAYPSSRPSLEPNDHPCVVSRESPYLATRFPNGAVAVAAHYRRHVESWPGGFHRDAAEDERILAANPLPSDALELEGFRLAGDALDYRGKRLMSYRRDASGRLIAFAGYDTDRVRINGREWRFADQPLPFAAWAPVALQRRVAKGAVMEIWVQGTGRLTIPLADAIASARLFTEAAKPGFLGNEIAARVGKETVELDVGPGQAQGHLFLIPG